MAKSKSKGGFVFAGIAAVALAPFFYGLVQPHEPSYRFVTVDHPIDMWRYKCDTWAYYGVRNGKIEDLLKEARAELLPRGYTEDASKKPWRRFIKGKSEVVICYHDQFAVEDNRLVQSTLRGARSTPSDYNCVLVKNGPGTEESLPLFQVKKLIHGW